MAVVFRVKLKTWCCELRMSTLPARRAASHGGVQTMRYLQWTEIFVQRLAHNAHQRSQREAAQGELWDLGDSESDIEWQLRSARNHVETLQAQTQEMEATHQRELNVSLEDGGSAERRNQELKRQLFRARSNVQSLEAQLNDMRDAMARVRLRGMYGAGTCRICCWRMSDSVFPCGHVVACYECGQHRICCPVCLHPGAAELIFFNAANPQ